jgi:dynactin complex subunit
MTTPDDIVVALKELPQTEQEKVASAITRVVKSDPVLQVRYASLLNWLNDLWRNIKRTFWSMFNFVNLNAHDDE